MAQNPLNPKFPAGTISGTGGTVYNLLERMQTQLDPDAYGETQEIHIQGDPANGGIVVIGRSSPIAGDVSASNYGYSWAINSILETVYRSSDVQVVSLGTLQVFSASNWTLHVTTNA